MYVYKCKHCGKDIVHSEQDCVFLHRETCKYHCIDERHFSLRGNDMGPKDAKTWAQPEENKKGQKIVINDIPPQYAYFPAKTYKQRVHELWYLQVVDGGVYTIGGGQYTATTGREGYVEFNLALVKATAKYLNKEEETLFSEIWHKAQKENGGVQESN